MNSDLVVTVSDVDVVASATSRLTVDVAFDTDLLDLQCADDPVTVAVSVDSELIVEE